MVEIAAKVRIGEDPQDVVVIVRKVLRCFEGYVVGKFGLSGTTGEWRAVAEGQAYPEECLLPVEVWRDSSDLTVSEFAGED